MNDRSLTARHVIERAMSDFDPDIVLRAACLVSLHTPLIDNVLRTSLTIDGPEDV
jgi:hypothetical protein